MKRSLIAAALSLALAPGLAFAQQWSHNPESPIGPSAWGVADFSFSTCGAVRSPDGTFEAVGKKQSPVNIAAAAVAPAVLPAPFPSYGRTAFEIENTGHVVEVPVEPGTSSIRIGLDTYDLVQFHFHTPSEHAVNGVLAPMEVHFVHRNAQNLNLAVVGALIQVGPRPNALLEAIFRNAPLAEGVNTLSGTINPREALPLNLVSHWTYSGSLTTPPCSEGVRWIVLKTPLQVSQATVDRFKEIAKDFQNNGGNTTNNRPVQPLNGRVVLGN